MAQSLPYLQQVATTGEPYNAANPSPPVRFMAEAGPTTPTTAIAAQARSEQGNGRHTSNQRLPPQQSQAQPSVLGGIPPSQPQATATQATQTGTTRPAAIASHLQKYDTRVFILLPTWGAASPGTSSSSATAAPAALSNGHHRRSSNSSDGATSDDSSSDDDEEDTPTKIAIPDLESVGINSLGDEDKTCIICYFDFGTPSPEDIIEAPLRLPNCKHIFGEHCIKKWLKDHDTCPYCRDNPDSKLRTTSLTQHVRGGPTVPPGQHVIQFSVPNSAARRFGPTGDLPRRWHAHPTTGAASITNNAGSADSNNNTGGRSATFGGRRAAPTMDNAGETQPKRRRLTGSHPPPTPSNTPQTNNCTDVGLIGRSGSSQMAMGLAIPVAANATPQGLRGGRSYMDINSIRFDHYEPPQPPRASYLHPRHTISNSGEST